MLSSDFCSNTYPYYDKVSTGWWPHQALPAWSLRECCRTLCCLLDLLKVLKDYVYTASQWTWSETRSVPTAHLRSAARSKPHFCPTIWILVHPQMSHYSESMKEGAGAQTNLKCAYSLENVEERWVPPSVSLVGMESLTEWSLVWCENLRPASDSNVQ